MGDGDWDSIDDAIQNIRDECVHVDRFSSRFDFQHAKARTIVCRLIDAAIAAERRDWDADRGEPIELELSMLKSARWIAKMTAGRHAPGITREMLRNARERGGHLPGAVRRGWYWYFPLDEVCRTWPDYAPRICHALRAEPSESEHIGTPRS